MAGKRGINPKRQTNQFLLPSSSERPDGRSKCYASVRARPWIPINTGRCLRCGSGSHAKYERILTGWMRWCTGSTGRREPGGVARILECTAGVESERRGKLMGVENCIRMMGLLDFVCLLVCVRCMYSSFLSVFRPLLIYL